MNHENMAEPRMKTIVTVVALKTVYISKRGKKLFYSLIGG